MYQIYIYFLAVPHSVVHTRVVESIHVDTYIN